MLGDRQISLEAMDERLAKIEVGYELPVTRDEPVLAIQAFADRDPTESICSTYPSKEEVVICYEEGRKWKCVTQS